MKKKAGGVCVGVYGLIANNNNVVVVVVVRKMMMHADACRAKNLGVTEMYQ